jgi:hypothetical protein
MTRVTAPRTALAILAVTALTACTDAATRIAYDLKAGASRLRESPEESATVDHAPQAIPEGCPGPYTVQLSKESALVVWCQDAIGAPSTSSHITTYHLNSVTVPETLIVHKQAGEHARIELRKDGSRIAVVGLQ